MTRETVLIQPVMITWYKDNHLFVIVCEKLQKKAFSPLYSGIFKNAS